MADPSPLCLVAYAVDEAVGTREVSVTVGGVTATATYEVDEAQSGVGRAGVEASQHGQTRPVVHHPPDAPGQVTQTRQREEPGTVGAHRVRLPSPLRIRHAALEPREVPLYAQPRREAPARLRKQVPSGPGERPFTPMAHGARGPASAPHGRTASNRRCRGSSATGPKKALSSSRCSGVTPSSWTCGTGAKPASASATK